MTVDLVCGSCGHILEIGDWPFCDGKPGGHGKTSLVTVGDDIPGGFVQTNFGHAEEVFYSKKAMAKRAADLGLENRVKWAGPSDRHLQRWV